MNDEKHRESLDRLERICGLWVGIYDLFGKLKIEEILKEQGLSQRLRDRLHYLLAFMNDAVDDELEPRIGPYRHLVR